MCSLDSGSHSLASRAEIDVTSPPSFVIHVQGRWFVRPDGVRVNLRTRKVPAALLQALCDARLHTPGVSLAPDALIARLWPGQRILPRAARNRLHVAVHTLRRLGFASALRFDPAGYSLDLSFPFRRVLDVDGAA